ncbi:hypothetical protein PHAVU_008G174900 [Phaseolus vulgaris]|uniref:Protein kinase domain-containing protein n=1 Tax=Phaseolus vulgaris TaxID=3885 RepID=V7B8L1_PHAVU|nr:hypothetical protein PHAVU_008G174900g [Phaseolus vulgaris]ESW13188.1 hypothetical protein PHAVU_008G174900g [Phaseolus vulgaris]
MVMWREMVLLVMFLLFVVQQICATHEREKTMDCPTSSCGKITNISRPFRLKRDPIHCGDSRYELDCENNVTVLYLFSGKYHVQAINYHNFTIRVVDPGVEEPSCSSLPRYFLSKSNFTDAYHGHAVAPYLTSQYQISDELSNYEKSLWKHIIYLNCSHPVSEKNKYVNAAPCVKWQSKGHIYAIGGDITAAELEVGCGVKLVSPTSWWGLDESSYTDMNRALLYGFEMSWLQFACDDQCQESPYDVCSFNTSSLNLQCALLCPDIFGIRLVRCGRGIWSQLLPYPAYFLENVFFILLGTIQGNLRFDAIDYFDMMVNGFKEKLGEGGYGSVFKGKLSSGSCVAIKMLSKTKGRGHDFISEVATIGRIHHQNVVQLIGFCVEGSKHALVYEFMSNGSLDKIIFSKDKSIEFGYDKIYNIAIGVARGIAYLHHGCEMQILHFDIKPHNILLDDKFIPKVSDFGLAKLYPIDNSIVTMTTVGGTIGYMAPELFYKNIGRISYKSDVYSFGMLLMEMASRRKNLNSHVEHSSQIYFPSWIYDYIREEKDIEMEEMGDFTEEEKKIVKKMIIVAFWCIQMNPDDRPSMNKVVEMLEGDIEKLEIPPNFSLYPYDATENSKQTIATEFTCSSSYSLEID